MDIKIERGKRVSLQDLPPYSIAIDGFCAGPEIDAVNHRYSFDHHEKCLRFATLSACMQCRNAVLLGLDPTNYTIYANDVDSDVCTSIWVLQNPERANEPAVQKLITVIGTQDMYAGAFPINGMSKTVEWISAPEVEAKKYGDYNKLSDSGLYSILEAIMHRIDMYANGEAQTEINKQVCKTGGYKILRNENDWVLVESNNSHIYQSLYASGFDRIVLIRPQENSMVVSLAKRSNFIDRFPIEKMIEKFNEIENGWGGSDCVAGSVRRQDGNGTYLPIEKIIEIVDKCVLESTLND